MATIVSLPRQRIIRLTDPKRCGGFTHKVTVLASDLAGTSSTGALYVQLLPTPTQWLLGNAVIWGRTGFTPNIFTGGSAKLPALTTDTTSLTNTIGRFQTVNDGLGTASFIFPTPANTTLSNFGTSSQYLFLLLTSGGSNFTTLTGGELWVLLNLIDINLMI